MMFEHIVLRRATGGLPISAGYIAEALLYYQKLQLFVDRGTLFNLVRQLGTGRVLGLLDRANISAVYCEEMLGTSTDSIEVSQHHNYVAFTVYSRILNGCQYSTFAIHQTSTKRRGDW